MLGREELTCAVVQELSAHYTGCHCAPLFHFMDYTHVLKSPLAQLPELEASCVSIILSFSFRMVAAR